MFISYAQNNEDVMLFRALKDVHKGYYIDVGAEGPIGDSVTKVFYERGWHGINIEPSGDCFQKLEADRLHDINLKVAVADHIGELDFYELSDTGLSTIKAEYAARHEQTGYKLNHKKISCTTLDEICQAHEVGVVHFLKVDVEGAEDLVIKGCSFDSVRPWIVVIEATEPMSEVSNYETWEPLLLAHNYEFVYFDGLNRFYLAKEHLHLRDGFSTPPNYFDHYIKYPHWRAQQDLTHMHERFAELHAAFDAREHELSVFREKDVRLAELSAKLVELENSLRVAAAQRTQVDSRLAEFTHSLIVLEERYNETSQERDELLGRLSKLHELEHGKAEAAMQARNLRQELEATQIEREALSVQIQDIFVSHSWHITAPLRGIKRVLMAARRVCIQGVSAPRHKGLQLLRANLQQLIRNRWLRNIGRRIVAGRPMLKAKVREMLLATGVTVHPDQPSMQHSKNEMESDLPESARRIYAMLLTRKRS